MKKLIFGIILGFISLFTFAGINVSEVPVSYEELSTWCYLFDEPITFDFYVIGETLEMYITHLEYVNDSIKLVKDTIKETTTPGSTISISINNIIRFETNATDGKLVNVNKTPITKTICEFTEQDTIDAFNNGVVSVNTDSIYDEGYNNGVESVNTDSIYDEGYDDGVASVNCETKTTTINQVNVNVYPNPTTNYINVEVEDYDKTEVYSIDGKLLKTEYNKIINFTDLKEGMYILKVYNWDGESTNVKVVYR